VCTCLDGIIFLWPVIKDLCAQLDQKEEPKGENQKPRSKVRISWEMTDLTIDFGHFKRNM